MKKILMLIFATLAITACSDGDKTTVINNTDRVADLERRAQLNDDLNVVQSNMISMNSTSINLLNNRVISLESDLSQIQADLAVETAARITGEAQLQALIEAEALAREAGDVAQANSLAVAISNQIANNNSQQAQINALNSAAAAQSVINLIVQGQLALINSKFPAINSTLSSLQTQINNTNVSVSTLQSQVGTLQVNVSGLNSQMSSVQGSLTSLQSQITALTARLDAEGVKVFKCNMASSEERFFKINGVYYGAMNQVTTGTSTVVTSGTPQTVTTPKLCVNNGNNFKLPDSNGNCNGGGWSILPGSGVTTTIPAYSTSNITVVTSVQISLEPMVSGQGYQTTDGTAVCYFNGNGTNLVQVN